MKRAVTLVNRTRGGAEEVAAALASAGVESEVVAVDGPDLAACAGRQVESGVPLIIAAGGDGTVSAVAGAVAGSEATLGILPLGTLNHFARDLSIPFQVEKAVEVIAAGHSRRIDVAEVNGRAFINNASIGLYPLMVMDRDAQRERLGRSKRLAMLVASLRTMTRFHARRLTLSGDGGEARVDTPLLFVGNNDYRLAMPGAGRREALDDGQLCVMVLRSKSLPGFLAATARALLGLRRNDDMIRLDEVSNLRVDCAQPHLTLAVDGETLSVAPPLHFRIRPGGISVICP